ncbi:MAG: 4Fe-4S dicluster domain-containing protein [Betaproteobacteria bacterium]|nr:4Fe-4S dicluster domain-containing protein [Betaproteobacteria bacterium]MDE2003603.1 4Fe-4S dicluster domain-containing protein [Betaproteobacteria bacterium]MDE2208812.1 4Fe-4S dicluster domain-containing protein [Betaproteobacteria bacterium]MDE2358716.1 4Fe-4S dicluster domain-containing protein [Betaproteobacteria bacterium]
MKLGLVIDLDTCVGCHACAVACKEWNGSSAVSGPLSDYEPYGAEPSGVWFNRIRHYEIGEYPDNKTLNLPMSCMHCEDAACVTVCPTGASYKRPEDGIVLIDQDKCMGCNLCSWACPYGARELDRSSGTMKKCTLCVDRIYDLELPVEERQPACVLACPAHARMFGDLDDPDSAASQAVRERGGFGLMSELGYKPVNQYLPARKPRPIPVQTSPSPPPGRTRTFINRMIKR